MRSQNLPVRHRLRGVLGTGLLTLAVTLAHGTPSHAQSADNLNPTPNGAVAVIAIQPDGKIVIGGSFTAVGPTLRSYVARLNADGSLDQAFNPGANQPVRALLVQPDGKIVVGGNFSGLAGGARSRIGRLNPDGSLDPLFDPGAELPVLSLALQTDGKILVGGEFKKLGGGGTGVTTRNFIGRLHPDGALDLSFDPGANAFVYSMAVQPDEKIVVGGNFVTLGGGGFGTTARRGIGRLLGSGAIDPAFDPGTSFVRTIALQSDGKILVGGLFQFLGGGGSGSTPRSNVGRLNPDGSLDVDFDPGASGPVLTMAVDARGRILVAGGFFFLGGGGTGSVSRNYLGRLHPNGTVDAGIDLSGNAEVQSLAIQGDGRILVGGEFTALITPTLSFFPRARMARLTDGSAAIESP